MVRRTLDKDRLRAVKVTGRGLSADVVEATAAVSFGSAYDQVTTMSLTVNDQADLSLYRSGALFAGSTIQYGDWYMVVDDVDVKRGPVGPQLVVSAPSRTVTRLRGETGAKSWGTTDVAGWVRSRVEAVGGRVIVQPGLGSKLIAREAGEDEAQKPNSWDLMTDLATQCGVWLFENGPWIVFAKPSWLMQNPGVRRSLAVRWMSLTDYSEELDGMPEYEWHPFSDPVEKLTLRLVAPDADNYVPGDRVDLSGNVGGMAGAWIVTSASYPFSVGGVVALECRRPIDPKIPPPPTEADLTSSGGGVRPPTLKAPVAGRVVQTPTSGPKSVGGGKAPQGLEAAVVRWMNQVNGRGIDVDGAYGAQCVDLVEHYNANVVGGGRIGGNGKDIYGNAPSGNYSKIPGGGYPQTGDIVCWGSNMGGGYGHVAVCISNDWGVGRMRTMSQNPGPARPMDFPITGVQGFLRPKRWR